MTFGVKLTVKQQILHMQEQGITFDICNETQAADYLENHNNYFKLRSYRKNYEKNGNNKYVGLDFAYLKDIAIIDMRLRYCLLKMCLDIEHSIKIHILKSIINCISEDGYSVVVDFQHQNSNVYNEILSRASKSIYCAELYDKYKNNMPIWVFVEIMQFSNLCMFYQFIAKRLQNKKMLREFYMFQEIKQLRNACAHNNCVLNDLKSSSKAKYTPDKILLNDLGKIISISKGIRQRKMSNDRIRQITTLLYTYKHYVYSKGLQHYHAKELHEIFFRRFYEHEEYYRTSEPIKTTFDFFQKIIDNWYPFIYN